MAHAHAHAEGHHHIIPMATLVKVFAGLIVLTVVTVLTAQLDLGAFNVPLALAIAIGKASLVVTIFMALKYDKKVNVLVFSVGILFVVVFLVFTLFDVAFRGDLGNVSTETITDMMREEEAIRAREAALAPGAEPGATGAAADTTTSSTTAADTTGAAPATGGVDTTAAQPEGGQH